MRIIYTDRNLRIGDEIVIFAPTANKGEAVVFCAKTDTWGLSPAARGKCGGNVSVLMTPSKRGKSANANRFYKRFIVDGLL